MRKSKGKYGDGLREVPVRLSGMMSRIRIDIDRALAADRGVAIVKAGLRCRRCDVEKTCNKWLATHEEGAGERAPAFCRLRPYLDAARPVRFVKAMPVKRAVSKKPSR